MTPLNSQYNSTRLSKSSQWYLRGRYFPPVQNEGDAKKDKSLLVKPTHVPILVEHPNDPVSEVKDVSPVEIRHVGRTVLRWAVVQEIEDVFGGERRLL